MATLKPLEPDVAMMSQAIEHLGQRYAVHFGEPQERAQLRVQLPSLDTLVVSQRKVGLLDDVNLGEPSGTAELLAASRETLPEPEVEVCHAHALQDDGRREYICTDADLRGSGVTQSVARGDTSGADYGICTNQLKASQRTGRYGSVEGPIGF